MPQPLCEIRDYDLPDHDLMVLEVPALRIWTVPRPCVVVGQSNRVLVSLNFEALAQDEVLVYRRPSGGQPVLLSPRTLQISVVFAEPGLMNPRRHFERVNGVIRDTIRDVLGIALRPRGISDLAAEDERKVLGSSIYRSRGRVLYHGVLNVSESAAVIARYLRHPPEEPDYRRGRPHEAFITSLADWGHGSSKDLTEKLQNHLSRMIGA